MIEKMKMVYVVSSLSRKKEMLDGLKKLGVMHIAAKKAAAHAATEEFTELSRTASMLAEYVPGKKELKNLEKPPVLTGDDFDRMYSKVKDDVERKYVLTQELTIINAELDRIVQWGDFDPEDLEILRENRYDLHFYRAPGKLYEALVADEKIKVIHLKDVKKEVLFVSIGKLPPEYAAAEFNLPERGVAELEAAKAEGHF